MAAALTGVAALLAGVVLALVAGLALAAVRLRRANERLPVVLPLEGAARAVAEAYVELGELTPAAGASLAIEPRSSGYRRCRLTEATPEESARFSAALDELLTTAARPRLLVTRPLPDPEAGAVTLLTRRRPFPLRRHSVPSDLGRDTGRSEAFARAWRRHVGPGALLPGSHAQDGGYETLVRAILV